MLVVSCLAWSSQTIAQSLGHWTDVTDQSGLEPYPTSRVKFANLNNDIWPDVILLPETNHREQPVIYLHAGAVSSGKKIRYKKKENTGLPALSKIDVLVFADLNNDGSQDAILARYLDIYQDDYEPPSELPTRTAWLPGNGNGTFGEARIIARATPATTRAISVGDINVDGLPDLYLGNWYERYFTGYEAFSNDLLLQFQSANGTSSFARWAIPQENQITSFDTDLGGRPTYGVAMPILEEGIPMLLELNYGRRWNRLYRMQLREPLRSMPNSEATVPHELQDARAQASDITRRLQGENIAGEVHIDGDEIRHGRYPNWPRKNADGTLRPSRRDEPPFRANGNTFDAAVGDIDNDGDFDLFLSTIIHAWAGDSSDRSRFLVNQLVETGRLDFKSPPKLNVDRIPSLPKNGEPLQDIHKQYNQGDIYAELADFNQDGRLDLLLCSSDYPDPPPHDERLRLYFQQEDGRFQDVTQDLGIDHVGAGMPSLGDIDNDGDLDLLIGQSFNRLTADQRRQAAQSAGTLNDAANPDIKPKPAIRLFRNESTQGRSSLILELSGASAKGVCKEAFGTVVRITADTDGNPSTPDVTQQRQVLGPYGHSGKQHMFALHFGLGKASKAKTATILWPNGDVQQLADLEAGRHKISQSISN